MCSKVCQTNDSLTRHIKSVHLKQGLKKQQKEEDIKANPILTLRCQLCQKVFRQQHQYLIHKATVHSEQEKLKIEQEKGGKIMVGKRPIICSLCQKSFTNSVDFGNHCVQVHQIEATKCKFCDFKTHQKTEMHDHCIKKHKYYYAPKLNHLCPKCPEKFHHQQELAQHLADKHKTDPRPFACPHCKSRFDRKSAMNSHIHFMHKKEIICHYCTLQVETKTILKQHLLLVHGKDDE